MEQERIETAFNTWKDATLAILDILEEQETEAQDTFDAIPEDEREELRAAEDLIDQLQGLSSDLAEMKGRLEAVLEVPSSEEG